MRESGEGREPQRKIFALSRYHLLTSRVRPRLSFFVSRLLCVCVCVCDGLPLYALSPDAFPIYACAQLIARHVDAGQLLNSSNVLTLPAPPASLDELTQLLRLHHGASFRSAEQEVRYFPSSVPHPHFRARGFIQSLSGLPETSEDAPLIAVPNPCAYSAERQECVSD